MKKKRRKRGKKKPHFIKRHAPTLIAITAWLIPSPFS